MLLTCCCTLAVDGASGAVGVTATGGATAGALAATPDATGAPVPAVGPSDAAPQPVSAAMAAVVTAAHVMPRIPITITCNHAVAVRLLRGRGDDVEKRW